MPLFLNLLVSLFSGATLTAALAVPLPDTETGRQTQLPDQSSSGIRFSKVIGWPTGATPQAPDGFFVSHFATDLISPRQIYQAPNGDIFVAEANTSKKGFLFDILAPLVGAQQSQRFGDCACRITRFHDSNGDGQWDQRQTYLANLNQPYGMLVHQNYFYVAQTDGVWRYPYRPQDTTPGPGEKIVDLPAGGYNNHWTRNLIASPAGDKIYISVGSASNIGEYGMAEEQRRANVLEINPDGSGERVFARGLRNPVGLSWSSTDQLWTVVNERDGLGDALVPDYLTALSAGQDYGWPYSYFGQHIDPRVQPQNPQRVAAARVPDYALGSHTASLGLDFYHHQAFPQRYRGGAFIGQHGSWNRSQFVGYQVAFVPFQQGRPAGPLEPFLTGFIADLRAGTVYGRPVGVLTLQDGSLLVADDAGNTIWRVRAWPEL